jgi:hypothetical protein
MNRVTGVILIGFGLKLGASDISFEWSQSINDFLGFL